MKSRSLRIRWAGVVAGALAACAVVCGAEPAATEALPAGAKVVRLEVFPAAVTLKTPFAYSQILVTGRLASGEKVDLTRLARVEAPPALARVSPRGVVRPAGDGRGELVISALGQSARVPLAVSGQKADYAVSFVRDIMPTMSRLGCNAGTCHGSAKGKNGFKLSLRGYDPLADHLALTDDLGGRRFDRASPDHSLMLLKPSGSAPHVGGVLMQPGEPAYELLRGWIAQGVKLDASSPRVASIDIFPKGLVLPLPGMKQQMAVWATYSDGAVRDVTYEAFVETSNMEVATAEKQGGLVTAVRRGEATVLARYEGAYTATSLVVMGDRSGFAWKNVPEYNFVDALVYEKLRQVKVLPSDVCTDAEFVRRVYLDLTGLPPQPEELKAFLADRRPTRLKREELVDRLIGSPDFVEFWTNKWADLLQVNRKYLGEQGAAALRNWIRQAVASNMPYDKFAHTVLTASGSNLDNPPAGYWKVSREPGSAMENTTQLFLAIRFNCNKCHDHPFERWTQDQYYHLAAYFARVGRKEDPKFKGQKVGGTDVDAAQPLVEDIADLPAGEVKHERTGALAGPSFPFLHPDLAPPTAARREQLAHWVTSRDNPYFAKSYVNRLWSYLLGVGLIEPVDDIRAGNPPSNPRLLDRLTREFIEHGFDVRHMMRTICKSRTYQLSIVTNDWNRDDDLNFSHAVARRLPAEVFYDAIHRVTGSVSQLPGLPPGARAAQLLDSAVDVPGGFFTLLGKPPRESACECERTGSMMLGPVLNLVNGPVIADALKDPGNRINQLVAREKDDAKVVEEIFLAVLCRKPTAAEVQAGVRAVRECGDDYTRLVTEYGRAAAAVAAYEKLLPAKQAEWEKTFQNVPAWAVLAPKAAASAGGATLKLQPDGSVLAAGKNPSPEVYTVTTPAPAGAVTALKLEVLTDPSLPQQGPGRAPNGNFVLNEFRVTALPGGDASRAKVLTLRRAIADYSQPEYPVAAAIDGKPDTGWAVDPAFGKAHTAIFELAEPLNVAKGTILAFTLEQRYPGKLHNIGRFRLSATASKQPLTLDMLPEPVAKALQTPAAKRTARQKAEVAGYYRALDPELARLSQALAETPRPPADPRQVGAQDLAWALLNCPEFQFNH